VATLESLLEKKRELEAKLAAGDASAETALARLDRAIEARTQKIQHSKKRLDVARDAVAAGMSAEEARRPRTKPDRKKVAKSKTRRPINRF
jgi:hypothetical protein